MVPEQVRHAVYVLDFKKLIMQTYEKNRSFAAKSVKKRTLSHKFQQAGPVSYSLTNWSFVSRVLAINLSHKVLTSRTYVAELCPKESCVAKF